MNTRLATLADAAILSRLSTDVQRLHADHHPKVFKMPENEEFAVSFFEDLLADPAVHAFLAEEEGSAAGYIVCKLIERPENPFTYAARTLLIDQISVRPEVHRQGVGAALMHRAEALAKEFNVERIHLDSWEFNQPAHAFFERLGYEKFNFRFWRWLK